MNVFGLEPEVWNALSAIGGIIGTAATVAAVIVALKLARRDLEPRLRINCSIMQVVGAQPKQEILSIVGTNVGHLPLTVKGIFWTFRTPRKQTLVSLPNFSHLSTPLPAELSFGQQCSLVIDGQTYETMFKSIAEKLAEHGNAVRLAKTLRCGIYTSIGKDFEAKVDERVREAVLAHANALKTTGPNKAE